MKKILTLLAIGIVGFTSCKEELVQVYSISIDPTELSFNSGGGDETVTVTSTADWKLSGDFDWCYASSYSGKGDAVTLMKIQNQAGRQHSHLSAETKKRH